MSRAFEIGTFGEQVEITPICIHRNAKPEKGQLGVYKCKIRPEVVHCCGLCVSCESYDDGGQGATQLTLF